MEGIITFDISLKTAYVKKSFLKLIIESRLYYVCFYLIDFSKINLTRMKVF